MDSIVNLKRDINVAILGSDHYARMGISALLKNTAANISVKASVCEYHVLEMVFESTRIDLVFLAEPDKRNNSFDYLKQIKKIRSWHPEIIICMYAVHSNSMLWIRGDIDSYISLQEPLYIWRANILKLIDARYRPAAVPPALTLTHSEWTVLKELKKGQNLRHIAEMEKISYRRVSALKSSAIRKLGLRNKTELLVFLTH